MDLLFIGRLATLCFWILTFLSPVQVGLFYKKEVIGSENSYQADKDEIEPRRVSLFVVLSHISFLKEDYYV